MVLTPDQGHVTVGHPRGTLETLVGLEKRFDQSCSKLPGLLLSEERCQQERAIEKKAVSDSRSPSSSVW